MKQWRHHPLRASTLSRVRDWLKRPKPENEPQSAFGRHGQSAEVKMKRLSRWLAFVFSGLVLFPSVGSTQAPYYAGKTITVIEGNRGGNIAEKIG